MEVTYKAHGSPKRTRIPLRWVVIATIPCRNVTQTTPLLANGRPYRVRKEFHCQKWRLCMARRLLSKPIYAKEERHANTEAAMSSRKDMLTWCHGWMHIMRNLRKDATPPTSVLQQQIEEHNVCVCVCVCLIFYKNDCCDLWCYLITCTIRHLNYSLTMLYTSRIVLSQETFFFTKHFDHTMEVFSGNSTTYYINRHL